MHPSFQHRRDCIAVSRQRAACAVAAIYIPTGLKMPAHFCRFKVVPAIKGWYIVDSVTGRVSGMRSDHNKACALAQQLESLQRSSA